MKFRDDVPIYRQISRYISGEIISGRIHAGTKIPSVRQLALQFSVNTNTVQRALREMIAAQILKPRRGKGNFVTTDTAAIAGLREMMVERAVLAMYQRLHALNINDESIKAYIDNFLRKRSSEDGKSD